MSASRRSISPAEREALHYAAAFLAGKAFLAYRWRDWAKRSPPPDLLSAPMPLLPFIAW
jgi:hypothetical protein